jgi:two-component system LytT family response regulator
MKWNQSISAVIIDDDPFSRDLLKDLIDKYLRHIDIKELCNNGAEGLQAIERWHPDIIFLDVEMPDMTGFDMLKQIQNIKCQVIFTSSFDYYAIRAIRFAAIDYLLKPIQPEVLQEAVSRAMEKIKGKKGTTEYLPPAESSHMKHPELSNIAIPTVEGLLFVKTEDIIRCEAYDRYTKLFISGKKVAVASRTLGDFEDLLRHSGFIRIHNAHLVNLKHLKKYIKGEGGQVIMSDDTALDVSRRKKDGLLQAVSQFK